MLTPRFWIWCAWCIRQWNGVRILLRWIWCRSRFWSIFWTLYRCIRTSVLRIGGRLNLCYQFYAMIIRNDTHWVDWVECSSTNAWIFFLSFINILTRWCGGTLPLIGLKRKYRTCVHFNLNWIGVVGEGLNSSNEPCAVLHCSTGKSVIVTIYYIQSMMIFEISIDWHTC